VEFFLRLESANDPDHERFVAGFYDPTHPLAIDTFVTTRVLEKNARGGSLIARFTRAGPTRSSLTTFSARATGVQVLGPETWEKPMRVKAHL